MQALRAAFTGGLNDARRLRLALPLYLVGLGLGLIQTWPLLFGAATGRLAQTNLRELLASNDALLSLLSVRDNATLAGVWALLVPLLTLLYGLAYNLFSGGIISAWAGAHFWQGCRRFFWTFSAIGALLVLLGLLVIGGAGVLAAITGATGGPIVATLAFVLLQLANLVGEYARTIAVARNRRNPFVILGAAISFCARHPGALLLGLTGLLLHGGLALLYLALTRLIGSSLLVIVLDQALIVAWLGVKLLRLAWAFNYLRATNQLQSNPGLSAGIVADRVPM